MKVKMIVIINNSSDSDDKDDNDRKESYRRCIRGEKSGAIDEKRRGTESPRPSLAAAQVQGRV